MEYEVRNPDEDALTAQDHNRDLLHEESAHRRHLAPSLPPQSASTLHSFVLLKRYCARSDKILCGDLAPLCRGPLLRCKVPRCSSRPVASISPVMEDYQLLDADFEDTSSSEDSAPLARPSPSRRVAISSSVLFPLLLPRNSLGRPPPSLGPLLAY